ncbi:MAG: hypothetical protein WAM66_05570 [Acidobacteriaceae bacterium]
MREVLEYLFGRLKAERPVTHEVNGQPYAVEEDGTLGEPVRGLAPQWTKPTLQVVTLRALADAYRERIDGLDAAAVAFHISHYRAVQIVSLASDDFGERHVWVRAMHSAETKFEFGKYYEPEDFLIKFRSSFLFNDEAVKVQQLCSSVGSGDAVLVTDDGTSQQVEVKSGTVTRSAVTLPSDGVELIPWRTFRDAHPVASRFLLRMKAVKDHLPQIALFEIDAKWELDTVASIRGWIEKNVPDAKVIA